MQTIEVNRGFVIGKAFEMASRIWIEEYILEKGKKKRKKTVRSPELVGSQC
jgi:hypothetical protein